MCKEYYAKSRLPNGHQPTVKEHLEKVSALAAAFGAQLGMADAAMLAGLLHDYGKYSERFRGVLQKTMQSIDHALPGAALLYDGKAGIRKGYRPIAEAINGHHAGLVGAETLEAYFKQSRKDTQPVILNDGKTAALAGEAEYGEATKHFLSDFPAFRMPRANAMIEPTSNNVESMLCTRMLFSCLVDADYSISASDETPDYLPQAERSAFDPAKLLHRLTQYQETIRKSSNANRSLNQLRDDVFSQCGNMAKLDKRLFTLTAPTGVGKTLALLYFALMHCLHTGKERIIVVLPFLTLAEQNTAIYRNIVPAILEDHSQSNLQDDEREFAARWSTPMIVTTSVKFFESLFAQRPTECRKLHHIANSVVLFDEAQSLPPEITTATLQAVNMLCRRYRCTMVFSTATQPDFSAIQGLEWAPTEIIPAHRALYAQLKRTHVDWRIQNKTPLHEIAQQMRSYPSVCAIVNVRKHARALYQALKAHCMPEELFFLTTDLCPAHRSELIATIRQRLDQKLPCRVVSTQCIEAGVDLDFDRLYRALAPLDSIIQAAGRCNRNGRIAEGGHVTVFIPEEEAYPGEWYQNAALLVKHLWMSNNEQLDIHDPDQIKQYYHMLFQNAKDKSKLEKAIADRNFAAVNKEYALISNDGVRVIVPYDKQMPQYEAIRSEGMANGITPALMQKAASITVTTFEIDPKCESAFAEALLYPPRRGQESRRSNFYVLRPQHEALYSAEMGLQFPEKQKDQNYCF